MAIKWPECFETGILGTKDKAELICIAYTGWAHCKSGNSPPEKFGAAMVAISDVLGVSPQEDNLDELVKELGLVPSKKG